MFYDYEKDSKIIEQNQEYMLNNWDQLFESAPDAHRIAIYINLVSALSHRDRSFRVSNDAAFLETIDVYSRYMFK